MRLTKAKRKLHCWGFAGNLHILFKFQNSRK
ncbi:hypothetical protein ES332_D11G354100v1 [Gossypium tomentosum]|uniref:Uncharacterized protein n=1 Tax=Gossypium tomentosum TaxID=34277 RepID=A0A5D2IW96_GOSTO|nr:hypothetical protein ES332_D11G354100v1 [Gossypium tomentosum]